jgi:pimeloyl-ACP methyl ester carboxylesterase
MVPRGLFVPGWGAPAALYTPGLPLSWAAAELPSFAASGGRLREYRRWLGVELGRRGLSPLGGHSMGAALAIIATAEAPELVERLVLIAPAGLPLLKPIRTSIADFASQVAGGSYPLRLAATAAGAVARAPRAALRLAAEIRGLDLLGECARVRAAGVPALVVGCTSDTLVTCDSARTLAGALGATYRELDLDGGHMWMLAGRDQLAAVVSA